jgi:hypothetical protein
VQGVHHFLYVIGATFTSLERLKSQAFLDLPEITRLRAPEGADLVLLARGTVTAGLACPGINSGRRSRG